MLISVPNASSKQAEVFGEFWLGYDLPRHLWHFSSETLHRLLSSIGFEIVYSATVEVDVFARLSSRQMIKEGMVPPQYRQPSVNRLEEAGLGTELVFVAKATG
jgi:hypothetical protein